MAKHPQPRDDGPDDATLAVKKRESAAPLSALVRVLDAPASPASFNFHSGRCVLGAGARADILIDHATVSRDHASLELVPEGVVVTDLGSRNGTFYLGQRVQKILLGLGSRIRVGTVNVALDADTQALLGSATTSPSGHRGLLGVSPPMRQLFSILLRLEGSLVSVLIDGESGSGKEVIARTIHEGSLLSGMPLVVVNCGAIARELVLSELFGHARGAFTGAVQERMGAFEAADGGTLFLDELGELPLEVQPVLLRALESGEIQRVGETTPRKLKVRLIAATNRNLEEQVKAGGFREDLYYRLAVVRLTVPPLRERRDDIPILALRFATELGLSTLPEEVLRRFQSHAWPGNARELRNAVQAYIAVGALPGDPRPGDGELDGAIRKLIDLERPYGDLKEDFVHRFTKIYLEMLLQKTGPNQSEASRVAGLDRGHLRRMLARYDVPK